MRRRIADLGLEIRRLDVGDQPPFEAAAQALLEGRDVPRRAVGGDDDLLLARVERIEGVEELLLGALLVGEELDVVDQQHVDRPVALAEGGHAVETDRVDELVDELLGGQIEHPQLRARGLDVRADAMEEMGLAEAHPTVKEERVVALEWRLGDRPRRGVGELVRAPDDEVGEQVLGVELARSGISAAAFSSSEKRTLNDGSPRPAMARSTCGRKLSSRVWRKRGLGASRMRRSARSLCTLSGRNQVEKSSGSSCCWSCR